MAIKVLLIDFKDERTKRYTETIARVLSRDGIQVKRFYWLKPENYPYLGSRKRSELNISKAIEAAKTVDVVWIHFGSIPRGKAAEILDRMKATGIKIIVNTISPILFEAADYTFSVLDYPELLKAINNLAKEKNRSL